MVGYLIIHKVRMAAVLERLLLAGTTVVTTAIIKQRMRQHSNRYHWEMAIVLVGQRHWVVVVLAAMATPAAATPIRPLPASDRT